MRYAVRRVAKAPGFALAAVVLLGLGIGASTAIFAVVDSVLLEPLVPDQDRVVVLYPNDESLDVPFTPLSIPDFRDWRTAATSFDELAGFGNQSGSFSLEIDGAGSIDIRAHAVTPSFFEVIGVAPLLGRGFLPGEDRPESDRVVVFSHRVWQTVFGGDSEIIGRELAMDDHRYVVVGVMPPGFDFPNQTGLWAVARFEPPVDHRGWGYLLSVGRVSRGVSTEYARAEMEAIDDRLLRDTGRAVHAVRHVEAVPILDFFVGPRTRSAFVVLGLGVGLLFLVSCVNIASLFLARTVTREREIQVLFALGGSRTHIARALLSESVLLTLSGGALGACIAWGGLGVILVAGPANVPRLTTASVDATALVFAAVLSGLVSVPIGCWPALRLFRRAGAELVRSGSGLGASRGAVRIRDTLLGFEVASAVVLVVVASLLVASARQLMRADLGYRSENLLLLGVAGASDPVESPDLHRGTMRRLLDGAASLPDVVSASIVMLPPFQSGKLGWDMWWVAESQELGFARRERINPNDPKETLVYFGPPPEAFDESPRVNWEAVSGSYFRTMGISLLRGRTFDARDHQSTPRVVIVSESFARSTWPGEDPIGKRMMTLGFRYDDERRAEWQTVVGVVANARYRELDTARMDVYVSYQQSPLVPSNLVIRSRADATTPIPALREWRPMWTHVCGSSGCEPLRP